MERRFDNRGYGDAESENRLADKLSDLEQKMKQLQQSLMEEKLKLNRERFGEGDELPDNWESMNRLHLPQCPLAKEVRSAVSSPQTCPVHGHLIKANEPQLSSQSDRPSRHRIIMTDTDRYSKMISEAEKFAEVENINDKFRELYDSSMFSPTFYRPRPPDGVIESELEKRLVRFTRDSSSEETNPKNFGNKKSLDFFDNTSVTRNTSSTNSATVPSRKEARSSDKTSTENITSDNESTDVFNPFGAIENVRNKFLEIENYIQEASYKSRIKEVN